jgi:glycosyltransferase involved in cell wall biosynthesis
MRGYEVLAVLPFRGPLVEDLQKVGAKTEILNFKNAIWPERYNIKTTLTVPKRLIIRLWVNHFAERKLRRIVESFQPDVIHSNTGVLRIGYYVAKKMNIPHVWHIRETETGNNVYHYPNVSYQKRLLNNNTFNIAITQNVKNYYCLNDDNTMVVYDGVFEKSYKAPLDVMKKKYFLFVGRVSETKGADWAIKAFLNVARKYPEYELWLAGRDDFQFSKEIKSHLKEVDNGNRIKFLGARQDVYQLMAQAQAVIVASLLEAFGFITVEAMINNAIVIGRNTAGTREQFENGLKIEGREIGLRFESIDELSNHIEQICKYGCEPYKAMNEAAQRVVRKLYTIEGNVDQIEQIYNAVVKNRK